jgi:hypothetical protein
MTIRPYTVWTVEWRTGSVSESYITTDGQSASLFSNKAPIWGLRPDFYYRQTVAGLIMWGALSDERAGLLFTTAAGPRKRSHFRVRVADLLIWGALSDERTCLPFTTAAGPRQRSHFRVRVPWDWWPYFTVSDSILPQPGGPGPRIYIPQGQGGPVILPGTRFPFRRLLRLAGLRWRYSNPRMKNCEWSPWEYTRHVPHRGRASLLENVSCYLFMV